MRKIEKEMINAIENSIDWKKDNTEVFIRPDGYIKVLLHENCIAYNTSQGWKITNCSWITPTTSSRLNALSTIIGSDLFQGVCIRKGSMYIKRGKQLVFMNNSCPV